MAQTIWQPVVYAKGIMKSRSTYNLKIETISTYDIPLDRSFLKLWNGVRHVMPSTDRRLELKEKTSMAQNAWQASVYANGLNNTYTGEEKTNRWHRYWCLFTIGLISTCFRHHYAHRQENRLYKTTCGVSLDVLAAVVWNWDMSWAHCAQLMSQLHLLLFTTNEFIQFYLQLEIIGTDGKLCHTQWNINVHNDSHQKCKSHFSNMWK